MKDGPENTRMVIVNTNHKDYQAFYDDALAMHLAKEPGNSLTVIPFDDKKRALIKLCGPVGWLQKWKDRLQPGDFILKVYTCEQLEEVNRVLGESARNRYR